MRFGAALPLICLALAAGCTTPGGPYPSLQPRAAEMVDPRVPVERPINDRAVSPALAAQLASLVAQARTGDAAFQPAAARAEQLAGSAGAARSEGWMVAQEALSGAIAARHPTTSALAEIDRLAASALQTNGGIAPNDLAAIKDAAAEAGAIEARQAARIDALQRRLGV